MAEVMNRAARRAAGIRKASVRVYTHIDVVPMEHVETYFTYEIASEGKWRSNVPLIIIRPPVDSGHMPEGWFQRTLDRMHETRARKGTQPATMKIGGVRFELDVGLVDVVVFFQTAAADLALLRNTPGEMERIMKENFRQFDQLCQGDLHDQMIIVSAIHRYQTDGTALFHIHNLIFGLRQEVRGDMDILEPLDMNPLLKTLTERGGPMNLIGGVKQ
jgi:hypothetical protein